MQESLKILVAGGCHVQGWLVGKRRSFVQVLSDQLTFRGIDHKIDVVPYFTISKLAKNYDSKLLKENDIIVLQLGNYEFSPSLRADVKRLFKKKNKVKDQSKSLTKPHDPLVVDNPNKTFALTSKFKIGQKVKLFANILIGNSWLNKKELNKEIEEAFKCVSQTKPRFVIVLSPFPTSNEVTNIYRRKGGKILKTCSEKLGFQYVDIMEAFSEKFPKQIVTIDEMHLNASSHKYIGHILFSSIDTQVKNWN